MKKAILVTVLAAALALIPAISFASVDEPYTRTDTKEAPAKNAAQAPATTAEATLAQSTTASVATDGTAVVGADGSQNFKKPDGTLLKSDWAVLVNAAGKNVWKYYDKDGKMLVNTWVWVKGKDGKQRCYYLGADGTCFMNGVTPDGYTVDANGAWYTNNAVQTK